jgi:eight-cysteine-cluster-containing protein
MFSLTKRFLNVRSNLLIMKYLLFMGGLLIFLLACTSIPGAECRTDADCVTGGCSGVICASKDSPPIVTTCEFFAEYECYQDISCGCVDHRCGWKETPEFEQCVAEKRAQAHDEGQI